MTQDESQKQEDTQEDIQEEVVEDLTVQEQLEQYKTGWLRAQADYANLQKEMAAKRSELMIWSERQILEEFIPVLDNFKKAFASKNSEWEKEQENWVRGIEFIMKQFDGVLKNHNVESIKTVGEEFNTELHEAAGEVHSDEFDEGVIVREVDAGYTMKGNVIKVAKVIVCKKD